MKLIDEARKHIKVHSSHPGGKLAAAIGKYSTDDQFDAVMAVMTGEVGVSLMSRLLGLQSASVNNWMLKILRDGVRDGSITITRKKGKK